VHYTRPIGHPYSCPPRPVPPVLRHPFFSSEKVIMIMLNSSRAAAGQSFLRRRSGMIFLVANTIKGNIRVSTTARAAAISNLQHVVTDRMIITDLLLHPTRPFRWLALLLPPHRHRAAGALGSLSTITTRIGHRPETASPRITLLRPPPATTRIAVIMDPLEPLRRPVRHPLAPLAAGATAADATATSGT